MKLEDIISEKFVGGLKDKWEDTYFEVFLNASRSELKDIKAADNSYRFIISGKDVYIWDGWGLLHDDVWENLLKRGNIPYDKVYPMTIENDNTIMVTGNKERFLKSRYKNSQEAISDLEENVVNNPYIKKTFSGVKLSEKTKKWIIRILDK
jgi:hypothetical protein